MKKILFILAAIALVLTGCASGGPTNIKAKEMTKLLDADAYARRSLHHITHHTLLRYAARLRRQQDKPARDC